MVEIAKALSFDSELLVMDEPSAALTEAEVQELFRFIRDLKKRGHAIIYISHRLDELPQITDRITVMRDGQYVGTVNTADVTKEQIISMMVGRVIYEQPKTKSEVPEGAPVILEARGLVANNVKNVSFKLKKGEILGFAGLMGAGRTETMRALFGADPKVGGEIFLNGKPVKIESPADAVDLGIGYLSEDRKAFGVAVGLSVSENCVMANLDKYSTGGFINRRRGRRCHAASTVTAASRPRRPAAVKTCPAATSRGGHRQWLIKNCDILIFDAAHPRHRHGRGRARSII